jgi:hypothetical protein
MHVSSACGLKPRILVGNAGQNNRRAFVKFGDKRQIPAQGLDGLS